MSRRMSCALTIDAVRDRTKTVTRRHVDSWRTLEPGDRLTLIEKGMGLPKGAKQVVLAEVEVVDVRVEPLARMLRDNSYGWAEAAREGFEGWSPFEFCAFWMSGHGYRLPTDPSDVNPVSVRRIEWRYLDEPDPQLSIGFPIGEAALAT